MTSLFQTASIALMRKKKPKFETTGFSHCNPGLMVRAKARARALHMSFSGYLLKLIEADLARRKKRRRPDSGGGEPSAGELGKPHGPIVRLVFPPDKKLKTSIS